MTTQRASRPGDHGRLLLHLLPRRHRRRLAVGLGAGAALVALAACAGAGAGDSSGSEAGGSMPEPAMMDGAVSQDLAEAPADAAGLRDRAAPSGKNVPAAYQIERSVISTGVVALRADDVAKLRFDVRQVVDEHQGQISDEQTESDKDGVVARSRLVVRVPAKEFDATMTALQEVGKVESAQRSSEDVTTQVIDTDVRVRAQEASLQRMEALLAQAKNLRDIVSIETQLTRRQADLDSLKQQQAWLGDQTSMSTITVQLRKTDKAEAKPKSDDTGFLAGLASGWDGLKKVTDGGLTALGALLPFLVALLVIGLPVWYAGRRLLGRRTPVGAEPAAETVG
jgi:hypothetical protein